MRLALNVGFWGAAPHAEQRALVVEADRLNYDSVWIPEAYGTDSATPLAYLAALTTQIDLGSAVMQIPGRTPANTGMTAATIDVLSDGRFRLGLGVSGPQVSEGWHGVRFTKPLTRTREYVTVVRSVLAREKVTFDGEFFTLPLPDGPGKPLQLTVHPVRPHVPIYLASIGPRNLELTGEIADGWLAIFYAPAFAHTQIESIRVGRSRVGLTMDGFDVVPSVPVVIGDDVSRCADVLRANAALYIGGMGSREQNFYNQLAGRMGFEAEAAEIQRLYLEREYRAAAAAVPFDFIDATSLIGPPARITERLQEFAASGVTTLAASIWAGSLDERLQVLRALPELFAAAGVAER